MEVRLVFGDHTYKPRPRYPTIFHANIRDKKLAVKRLRAAFHKTKASLKLDGVEEPLDASVVLAEVTPRGVYLFTKTKMRKSTTLTFGIQDPLIIQVRGVVRFSEIFEGSLPKKSLNRPATYRTYIEFTLSSEMERDALEDLYLKVRDESYVATRWHYYRNEIVQREIRARLQTEKMQEQLKSYQDDPVLATEDILVNTPNEAAAG